jgi:hypothetical protein
MPGKSCNYTTTPVHDPLSRFLTLFDPKIYLFFFLAVVTSCCILINTKKCESTCRKLKSCNCAQCAVTKKPYSQIHVAFQKCYCSTLENTIYMGDNKVNYLTYEVGDLEPLGERVQKAVSQFLEPVFEILYCLRQRVARKCQGAAHSYMCAWLRALCFTHTHTNTHRLWTDGVRVSERNQHVQERSAAQGKAAVRGTYNLTDIYLEAPSVHKHLHAGPSPL